MQYSKFVKPAFDDFILPTKKYADIIIPRGGDNHVAIDLIVQHIRTKLGQHDLCKIYPNLYVIQSTFQVYQLFLFAIIIYCVSVGVGDCVCACVFKFQISCHCKCKVTWSCGFNIQFYLPIEVPNFIWLKLYLILSRYGVCIHLYVMLKQQSMILSFMLTGWFVWWALFPRATWFIW